MESRCAPLAVPGAGLPCGVLALEIPPSSSYEVPWTCVPTATSDEGELVELVDAADAHRLPPGWEAVLDRAEKLASAADFPQAITQLLGETLASQPREGATQPPAYRECRTASSAESAGRWTLKIPASSLATLQPENGQSLDVDKSFGTLSLDIPEEGETSQRICYEPGGWTELPPTRHPPAQEEVHRQDSQCRTMMIAEGVGLLIMAAGVATVNPVAFGAGVSLFLWALGEATHECPEAAALKADTGWMHCEGDPAPSVTWGGEAGNRFRSNLARASAAPAGELHADNLVFLSGGVTGDARTDRAWPVRHDAAGYAAGVLECNRQLQQGRLEAWQLYQTWGATQSGPQQAVAYLDAVVRLQVPPPIGGPGYDPNEPGTTRDLLGPAGHVYEVAQDIYYLPAYDALLVGCPDGDCEFEIGIRAAACGAQTLTPGADSVAQRFTGWPGCITLTLQVGAQSTTISLPYLSLDLDVGGEGGHAGGTHRTVL